MSDKYIEALLGDLNDCRALLRAWRDEAVRCSKEIVGLKEQVEQLEKENRDLWQRLQTDRLAKFSSNQDTGDEQQ